VAAIFVGYRSRISWSFRSRSGLKANGIGRGLHGECRNQFSGAKTEKTRAETRRPHGQVSSVAKAVGEGGGGSSPSPSTTHVNVYVVVDVVVVVVVDVNRDGDCDGNGKARCPLW
jgi:hypothetical protein